MFTKQQLHPPSSCMPRITARRDRRMLICQSLSVQELICITIIVGLLYKKCRNMHGIGDIKQQGSKQQYIDIEDYLWSGSSH
jgi:hypothetical protein